MLQKVSWSIFRLTKRRLVIHNLHVAWTHGCDDEVRTSGQHVQKVIPKLLCKSVKYKAPISGFVGGLFLLAEIDEPYLSIPDEDQTPGVPCPAEPKAKVIP
jgi:hypothetical protein